MEVEDLEFFLDDWGEVVAFLPVTDDIELKIVRMQKYSSSEYEYYCELWNNSCARRIDIGYELTDEDVNDIIIVLTH
jgi:hypothetical protein